MADIKGWAKLLRFAQNLFGDFSEILRYERLTRVRKTDCLNYQKNKCFKNWLF